MQELCTRKGLNNARPPRPFPAENLQKFQRVIADFLAKGGITLSLSPWAAPALFVIKKPDPVPGKEAWV
jgi:hypothetical protein